jgi:hypothetical protein
MAELRVSTVRAAASEVATPLLVLPVYERDTSPVGIAADVDQRMGGAVTRLLQSGDFKG